jgi:restriction endonuclease
LATLPDELTPLGEQVFKLVDGVFSEAQLPEIGDDRRPKKNPLNANFDKQEFKALWSRINRKAAYSVSFEEAELVQKAVAVLNDKDAWPSRHPVAVHHPARRAGRRRHLRRHQVRRMPSSSRPRKPRSTACRCTRPSSTT